MGRRSAASPLLKEQAADQSSRNSGCRCAARRLQSDRTCTAQVPKCVHACHVGMRGNLPQLRALQIGLTGSPHTRGGWRATPSLLRIRRNALHPAVLSIQGRSVCIAMKTPQTYLAGTPCSWANQASRRLGREGTSHMSSHTASRIAPGDRLCTRSHLTSRRIDREGSRNTTPPSGVTMGQTSLDGIENTVMSGFGSSCQRRRERTGPCRAQGWSGLAHRRCKRLCHRGKRFQPGSLRTLVLSR